MSDRIFLSPSHSEQDGFSLRVGNTELTLGELRIQSSSNFEFPHKVLGKGGANVLLNNRQLAELLCEYMRYVLCDISYAQRDVSSNFLVSIHRKT